MTIFGFQTVLSLTNISVSNTDVLSENAIFLEGLYSQTIISGVVADNVSANTDGSIIIVQLATILQASQFIFTNINSSTADSTNNYMILIQAMDLNATYPSMIQNISVNNSSIGLLHVQAVAGNVSDINMLMIQDIHIFDCLIENRIDMMTLTLLVTYDPYSIIFSNLMFNNLEFVQGGNLLNFEHLLTMSVQIIDSEFTNIIGGKINVRSFTSNIPNLSTNLVMNNITVNSANAKFGSFITLQTGAVLSISDSSFTNMN